MIETKRVIETKPEKRTLRQWREDAGLTQAQLAELSGLDQRSISNFETGERPLSKKGGARLLRALRVEKSQVMAMSDVVRERGQWDDDGYDAAKPGLPLGRWRQRRELTQAELAILAGVSRPLIANLERGHSTASPKTKRKLARALRISPQRLVLLGGAVDSGGVSRTADPTASLRAELRGARHALRKAYDILSQDAAITFPYQDDRDAVMPDIVRELKGT